MRYILHKEIFQEIPNGDSKLHQSAPAYLVEFSLLYYHTSLCGNIMYPTPSVERLDGSIDPVIHQLREVFQEVAQDTGEDSEGCGDNVDDPEAIRQGMIQSTRSGADNGRCDIWNGAQRGCILGQEGADESDNVLRRKTGGQSCGCYVAGDLDGGSRGETGSIDRRKSSRCHCPA